VYTGLYCFTKVAEASATINVLRISPTAVLILLLFLWVRQLSLFTYIPSE
jgi:hypothetical protein